MSARRTPLSGHRRRGSPARRWTLITLAWLLIAAGIMFTPLPPPLGLPMIGFGLILLLGNSLVARRVFARAKRRYPKTLSRIQKQIRRRRQPPPADPIP